MPKKAAGSTEVPKFTIERPKAGMPKKGRIVIPRVPWASLPGVIEQLLASAEQVKPGYAKGVITLF